MGGADVDDHGCRYDRNRRMDRFAARRPASSRPRPGGISARKIDRRGAARRRRRAVLAQYPLRQHDSRRSGRSARAGIAISSTASAPSFAGTRLRSFCVPTRNRPSSAATSPASSRPQRFTTSGLAISGEPPRTRTAATSCTSRDIPAPGIYARAFLEGRLSEQQLLELPPGDGRAWPLILSAPVADAGILAVPHRIDGAWARSWRSIRPAFSNICTGAASPTPRRERCGHSWAMARWTSRNPSARYRSPGASGSTTSSLSSTAICSASTGLCAAMARSCRSSRASSAAPAGT